LLDDLVSRPPEGRLVIRSLTCSICLLLFATPLIGQSPAGTVIVTNMSDATATLVDAATQQVVATLPTGAGPHEVATSANGRWAVATNYGNREGAGSTLTVIDVRARTVSRTIDLSPHRRPHSATFLPGDSLLAVTSEASQAVLIVHVGSGTIRRTIPTTQPASHMLAVTADGRHGFTSNISAGTISLLDMASGSAETLAVAPAVEGIGVRPSGDQVWVGSNANRTVSIVDVASRTVVDSLVAFGMPYRIVFTPDGATAIISDPVKAEVRFIEASTRREIGRLDLSSESVVSTAEVPGSAAPEGIAISPDGRWAFVTLQGRNELAFIDLRSLKIVARAPTGVWPDGVGFARAANSAR
jgi:YVTN family beta-propeller protein